MRQLRLYINAHEDGSVNSAEVDRGSPEDPHPVVLPLPRYVDVAATDLVECLTAQGGAYWVQSLAALFGVYLTNSDSFEELCEAVSEANGLWDGQSPFAQFAFDWESF